MLIRINNNNLLGRVKRETRVIRGKTTLNSGLEEIYSLIARNSIINKTIDSKIFLTIHYPELFAKSAEEMFEKITLMRKALETKLNISW